MSCIRFAGGVLHEAPGFKAGDPRPAGYAAWHEWAAAQHRAGLRQARCRNCGLWKFPQELRDGRLCAACAAAVERRGEGRADG
jgi:hypothetical protein